jgi:hypothetical protein
VNVESKRKPDVVISSASALGVLEKGKRKKPSKHQLYSELACEKPHGRFLHADDRGLQSNSP